MDKMTPLGALLEDHKKTKSPFIKMLADGMKAGDLVVLAADTALNTTNIGLVGLIQTGIEYTPA